MDWWFYSPRHESFRHQTGWESLADISNANRGTALQTKALTSRKLMAIPADGYFRQMTVTAAAGIFVLRVRGTGEQANRLHDP
jgi:hypothetical protein